MAELGGMLATAILKVVGEQICSVIGGQIALKMNFDEDLNKMNMVLERIDALLEDAERRSITDKSTRLWLKRLKDFMYEISDMIDEFEADTQAIIQPSARKKENESGYTGKQMIHNSLQKLIANKNILIVLDDLWEDNNSHLEELMGWLKVEESGKVVVIVTTRYEGIAKKICTIQPHKLAPLTDDQCWNIIKQKSDFELRGDKEELHHIGQDIARGPSGANIIMSYGYGYLVCKIQLYYSGVLHKSTKHGTVLKISQRTWRLQHLHCSTGLHGFRLSERTLLTLAPIFYTADADIFDLSLVATMLLFPS
ncbi:hypothetical protein ZWY2020_045665 [Hordeum vulgare]|nr:hypothetical protein ZWY2020_045665 [Hordeum vulgare]